MTGEEVLLIKNYKQAEIRKIEQIFSFVPIVRKRYLFLQSIIEKGEEKGQMGNFRKFFLNRALPFAVAMATALTGLPAGNLVQPETVEAAVVTSSASAAETVGLADHIQDGAILHCWCWSFNTIRENMADIAAAGFTTVQTSPANECNDTYTTMKLMGDDTTNGTDGCWWWHYQPTDWKIGNYQLGTKEDFKAMCEEADKYGIQVIVDVIPNHTTPDLDEISQDLYNAVGGYDNLFHGNGFNAITQWGDRYECTTGMMGGLPDVDTENPDFQVYFLNYLNDLIECGADGFRYDTAKHIGVPSDPVDSKSASKGETTNFWPVVTGKESVKGVSLTDSDRVFIYGEVLQGDNVPESEYAEYMRMTASSFGGTLRSAVKAGNFSVSTMSNLQHSTPSRLVTWVESHDTYCNEGESVGLTDTQIRLAWAVIAARKDGTPLFFSRPDGSDGWNNRWGNNVIGAKGNDQFMSEEVTAVNFFRNAMAGKSETLRNPDGNTKILQIDRGTEGTCIINLGEATTLNGVPTSMADGTYTDQVSGRTFTVTDGKLSGQLDGSKVAVVYNPTNEKLNAATEGGNTEFSSDTLDLTLTAKNLTDTVYTTSEGAQGTFSNGDVITVGSSLKVGESVTVTLKGQGASGEVAQSFAFKKVEKNIAYIKLPSGWQEPYCYVYNTAGGTNATWPGVKMEAVGDGVYKYEVPDSIQDPLVIFYGGDDTHRYPADMEDGLSLTGSMIYQDGSWKSLSGTDDPEDPVEDWMDKVDGSYDVYFLKPSGWGSTVYCYAYESETSNNGAWPGAAMENLGDSVYAYNLPEGWTDAKIIFTDGSSQIPGAQQPGMDWTVETSMLYANSEWKAVEKEDPIVTMSIESSLEDGSSFDEESAEITLTLINAVSGTYSVDDGPVKEFTDSTQVTIGKGKLADTDITVKVTATDGTEEIEKVFTYHKTFNAEKNGGFVTYTSGDEAAAASEAEDAAETQNAAEAETATEAAAAVVSYDAGQAPSAALGGYYATNPNSQTGANKTIASAADFDASTLIAQGVANDDPRIFRGSHEGPVYDSYALYGAWDDENIYLGWQFTNVTDVVDPAQGYPISDNGKPWNGDIPQMLAFNLGTGEAGSGKLDDGGYVWGLTVDFETPIDALMCFSSKPGVGQPALFTAENGTFSYDNCIGFAEGGISYTYEDGLFGNGAVTGINGNGYSGYVPSMLLDSSSDWVNFTELGHDTAQDTFYTMTIPMETLGVTKEQIETYGIGVMHLSTFGASTTSCLPMDMSMLDCAAEPYSQDDSTSAEKEDVDVITVPLACLGATGSDPVAPTPTPTPEPEEGTMTVNFGADRSAPQADTTDLTLKAIVDGGVGTCTYQFLVDGREVQSSDGDTYLWDTTGGTHSISVVVTDSEGNQVTVEKEYDVEGEEVPINDLKITSFTADKVSPQKQGTTVKFEVETEGGDGALKYRFYREQNGTTTVFRDYDQWNTAYSNPQAGDYTIYVDVKDAAGNTATASLSYTWEAPTKPIVINSFEADAVSPQVQGTTVCLSVDAQGGEGGLQYRFYRVLDGKTTVFRDYASSNIAYCNPQAGNYTIYADVKDEDGNIMTASMAFSWELAAKELTIKNITASAASPQKKGTTVLLNVEAEGGKGDLQYRFYREKDGVTTVFRDYQKSAAAYCNPQAGSYTIYVDVKDASGTVVTGSIPYTWEEEGTPVTVTSFTSDLVSPQKEGTCIRLEVNAAGGNGGLQYRFYRVLNGKTTVFRDYASSNIAYCNPQAGAYVIYVDVKDSTGAITTQQMVYTWES